MNQDFDLYRPSEEHEMLRTSIRSLAETKIAPYAAEVDEQSRFPAEALKALVA
ncbi:acyl-CoA dehydrogenase family protein, partial [Streptomyces rapamycinicus]